MGNIGNLNRGLVSERAVIDQRIADLESGLLWERADRCGLPLTRRERQILNYMAQGCLNKQIASILGVSEQTIKNHVSSILGKLGVYRRTEAVVTAIRQGLLSLEEIGSGAN